MQAANQDSSGADAGAEAEAFVPRGGPHGLRRRAGPVPIDSSPRSGRAGDGRRSTFREDVGHAAAETYLVTGLAFTLLGYLGWVICIYQSVFFFSTIIRLLAGAGLCRNFGCCDDMLPWLASVLEFRLVFP